MWLPSLETRGWSNRIDTERTALFREAQAVVESARVFGAHASSLKREEESRIRMAVDIMFPYAPLFEVLSEFAARHPHVTFQIFSTSLNHLLEQLQSGAVEFGIVPLRNVPPGVQGMPFTSIELIPVATKDHALAKRKERLSLSELRRHRQLSYVGSPHLDVEKRGRIFSIDVWTSNDLEMLRIMIKRGIGWGFATEQFFHEELASGEIVQLDCPDVHLQVNCPMGFVWQLDRPPGPLGQELCKSFTEGKNTLKSIG